MTIKTILLMYCIVIFMFIILFSLVNFKWSIKTIREIASSHNEGGYTKLIQLGLLLALTLTFVAIVVHYIMNPAKVNRIDIILTVIVGWLGLIIGRFFSERAMENLTQRRLINVEELNETVEDYKKAAHELLSKILKKK